MCLKAEESLRTIDATYRAGGLTGYYRGWLNRRSGNTPMSDTWRAQLYTRVGDRPLVVLALLALVIAWWLTRRASR